MVAMGPIGTWVIHISTKWRCFPFFFFFPVIWCTAAVNVDFGNFDGYWTLLDMKREDIEQLRGTSNDLEVCTGK